MSVDEYVAYLMSNVSGCSCTKAAQTLQVSHDEVNRFLVSSHFTGRDLFDSVQHSLELMGGILSTHDSVLDKPYTQPGRTELVGKFCGAARAVGQTPPSRSGHQSDCAHLQHQWPPCSRQFSTLPPAGSEDQERVLPGNGGRGVAVGATPNLGNS